MAEDYLCTRCREKFSFDKIRYDRNHKIVCKGCLGILEREEAQKERMGARDFEKVNFICLNCRFKFSVRRSSQQNLKCPYCNKTALMHVKKYKTEDDLISEATDERFDY
jgi:DNA-directed RNA polymerase subunit RPC12/RpoP